MTQIAMDAELPRADWDHALVDSDQEILEAIPEGSMLTAPNAAVAGALARITKVWFSKIGLTLNYLRTHHRQTYRELKDSVITNPDI
jgi:hypothetical protein